MTAPDACEPCLRRTHLVGLLATRIARTGRGRSALGGLFALGDDELVAGLGARGDRSLHLARERFDVADAHRSLQRVGLTAVCRHAEGYPAPLLDLEDAPAVLHVAGDLGALAALCTPDRDVPAVAVVGARRATGYGLETAEALGRGLAVSGVTVVSGMALGVDSAAHEGALSAEGATIAVLAGGADEPYPRSKLSLYKRIIRSGGCVVSEMPPGSPIMRWAFPARNRIIAALSAATVVVEARERSGSLITAEIAADLGRPVGAVPGRVTGSRSSGTNALLHDGAAVVRDAHDALDLAAMPGTLRRSRPAPASRPTAEAAACAPSAGSRQPARGTALDAGLRRALDAVEDGGDSPERLARRLGADVAAASALLTRLELSGHLRRVHDGTYVLRLAG
jgi:DNA processing protein